MRVIRSVSFSPDGVDVTYMDESDVRLEGHGYLTHTLSLSRERFSQEADDLEAAVQDFLRTAYQDWASSEPLDITEAMRASDLDDEDEDER